MKKAILTFLGILGLGISYLSAQIDTLEVITEFNSPALNPWGLTWDGTNLWIGDNDSGKIYSVSTSGETQDSIVVENATITGISFVNDTLWALNTDIVGDTTIGPYTYPVYHLYQIDKSDGNKIDTIKIFGVEFTLPPGGLWGLTYYDHKFYVSYDGGYGPCLIEIDRDTKTDTTLCCTHLVGMTIANDSIYAISHFDDIITTTDGEQEFWKYGIPSHATDITYDGANFWIMDTVERKVKKLEGTGLSINRQHTTDTYLQVFPNPTDDYIYIKKGRKFDIESAEIVDINGRIVESISVDKINNHDIIEVSHLENGVYFIVLHIENKILTSKFVKD